MQYRKAFDLRQATSLLATTASCSKQLSFQVTWCNLRPLLSQVQAHWARPQHSALNEAWYRLCCTDSEAGPAELAALLFSAVQQICCCAATTTALLPVLNATAAPIVPKASRTNLGQIANHGTTSTVAPHNNDNPYQTAIALAAIDPAPEIYFRTQF